MMAMTVVMRADVETVLEPSLGLITLSTFRTRGFGGSGEIG